MKLSIIVPCYNEEKNIPLILERFAEALDRDDVEVLLVNNGSTDSSANVLAELVPAFAFARVVTVKKNQGYGFGILSGLKEATGDFVGWTHADLQTKPSDVIKALELIEACGSPSDIFVKGERKGRPFVDRFFTVGMSVFESLYLGVRLWDVNGQPNLFHRSFYETWSETDPPHDFSLDVYAFYLAKVQNLRIKRFPVEISDRIHGVSSWNAGMYDRWKLILHTVSFSRQLKRRINNFSK